MSLTFILGILFVVLLILANGCLVAAEIALFTVSRSRLKDLADAGHARARLALELARNPEGFLPALQLGMVLLLTLAAAFAGATTVDHVESLLMESPMPWLVNAGREAALMAVVASVTLLMLVLGTFLPKQVALHNPIGLACRMAWWVRLLMRVSFPVLLVTDWVTDVVLRIAGYPRRSEATVSMQEIENLIEAGTAEGVLEPVEQKLAVEALRLGDKIVRQIMRPRIDIDAIDVATPDSEVVGVVAMAGFSRLPVYENDLDHVLGFVHLNDVLRQQYLGWSIDLRKLLRPALFIPDTMQIGQLLVAFYEHRNQLAIVVDEFGGTKGLVTLEDVLEELVGELPRKDGMHEQQQIVQRDATSWLIDGTVSIDDLLEHLSRQDLSESAPRNVSTVAGLVLEQIGRIPEIGEHTTWNDLRLEVVDRDGPRIDRVLVSIGSPHVPAT